MASFEEMLTSIRAGKPVPLNRFLKQSPKGLAERNLLNLFDHDGGYISGIADVDGFDSLCEHYGRPYDGSTRLTAAQTGRSHRVSVGGGMVTLRSPQSPHPVVVLVNGEGEVTVPRALAPNALIVENLENFLDVAKTVSFCEKYCGLDYPLDELEVIYGAGVQVVSTLYRPFLSRFNRLWVLSDADAGGLDICRKLMAGLSDPVNISVLVPSDLAQRLVADGSPLTESERERLQALSTETPAIADVAKILLGVGKKLEQETYLLDEGI